MSTDYNLTVEITSRFTADVAEELLDALADYHPAVGRSPRGRVEVIVTLPAADLRQAIATGLAVLERAAHPAKVTCVEAMTTKEFDARTDALNPVEIPELVSITEAADALGVSRQAVHQRIEAGTLPAAQIGKTWVIPKSAIAQAGASVS